MFRGRGRKRGPYSAYEFKGAADSVPRTSAYRAYNPPPPKIRRVCVAGPSIQPAVTVSDSAPFLTSTVCAANPSAESTDTPRATCLECVQDVSLSEDPPLNATSYHVVDHQPQDSPQNATFHHVLHHQPQDPPQTATSVYSDDSCDEDEEISFNEDSFTLDELPNPEDPGDSSDEETVLALAPGFTLSTSEKIKILLLLATKKRHNLTYSAVETILRLAGVWSKDSSFTPSKHILKSAITMYSSSLSVHHICPFCQIYVGKVFDDSIECRNCSRLIDIKLNKKRGNVFLYVSVSEQIKSLLTDSKLYDELINPHRRQRIQHGNYEDIFDGKFYKALVGPNCISFNFFVDGFQVRCTSKNSAWPVLISVNELPLHLRRKHILMASVWLGKKKPIMNEYLKPFVQECILLERDGISFKINGVEKHLRVIPLLCVSDSIARPTLRNSTQFNGDFGCGLCYHPAFGMQRGRGHCKSYSIAETEFPRRTHEETRENARIAQALGTAQQGIKGPSILSDIPGFDIINSLDLDLFHALVNCAKRFTNLWLSRRYVGRPFNVYRRFHEVDRRLLSITPTNNISRGPRSLSERSDYRGHEWFSWVVFYSIPVLFNIVSNVYLSHWALLVHGIVLLMQNSVSKADVVYAGRYLRQFNADIDRLYGAEHVTFSTHLLTHLEKSTENFSQPWTHSAFIFEDFIGWLKAAIHGSNGVAHQIVKYIQLRIALISMKHDLDYAMDDSERAFLQSVSHSTSVLAEPRAIVGDVSFLGEGKTTLLSANLHRIILREGITVVHGKEYVVFDRCSYNNEIYQSVNYERAEKQNNSVVLLRTDEVFEIHSFILVDNVAVALGHYLVRNPTRMCNVDLPHIKILNENGEENLRCVRVLNFDMKLLSFCLSISPDESLRFGFINVLEKEMLR